MLFQSAFETLSLFDISQRKRLKFFLVSFLEFANERQFEKQIELSHFLVYAFLFFFLLAVILEEDVVEFQVVERHHEYVIQKLFVQFVTIHQIFLIFNYQPLRNGASFVGLRHSLHELEGLLHREGLSVSTFAFWDSQNVVLNCGKLDFSLGDTSFSVKFLCVQMTQENGNGFGQIHFKS